MGQHCQIMMCTNGSHGWVSNNTFDWNPQSILNQQSIDNLFDTRSTLSRHLIWQSVKSQLISINAYKLVDTWPTIVWLLVKCQSSVNWVLIRMLIKMLIQGISQGCWSTLDHRCPSYTLSTNCLLFLWHILFYVVTTNNNHHYWLYRNWNIECTILAKIWIIPFLLTRLSIAGLFPVLSLLVTI